MREFEHVRVQSARNEWRHFPPLCALFATSFPLHFPHRLIKRYSLMMMVMVMMMMKEIFVFIRALSQADLIFLFGARLNWILHFGKPPRFKADVKIVQVLLQAQLNLLLSQVSISNSSLSFPDIFCMFFFFCKVHF